MDAAILTVAELTRQIRLLLEGEIGPVWVQGEISNLKQYQSGHTYFTLKDADSQIRCMVWAEFALFLNPKLGEGQQIQAYGRISVYEKRGEYQLYVENVKAAGQGALQIAFEKLKNKLRAEGLFDSARKRPLPLFPRCIGVVTSPTGAAIRDFLQTLDRRFPQLHILIYPSRVQGVGAAEEIAQGIRYLNSHTGVDGIIVMRGGGSLEDLWAFNEEVVARALAESNIPTISAVGHEVDFTISDFVADFRAATPTASAEQLIRSRDEWLGQIAGLARDLQQGTLLLLAVRQRRLAELREALAAREPRQVLREIRERLAELGQRLAELDPRRQLLARKQILQRSLDLLERRASEALTMARHRLDRGRERLELLSPRGTLRRGYSMTFDAKTGRLVTSPSGLAPGDRLRTELADGSVESRVAPAP